MTREILNKLRMDAAVQIAKDAGYNSPEVAARYFLGTVDDIIAMVAEAEIASRTPLVHGAVAGACACWGGGVMRGYAAIGLVRPKDVHNVGGVLRAAYCYGAAMVAIQGDRTPIRSHQDTPQAWRHIPVLRGNNLRDMIPFDAVPIAVDLVEDAVELPAFQHPPRAFYVFGPEDGTLGSATLQWCERRIVIPTKVCMNLAATVNVVLYDRLAKTHRQERGVRNSQVA